MKEYQKKNREKMNTNEYDYYNRPSIETSYKIAVGAIIAFCILMMGLMIDSVL